MKNKLAFKKPIFLLSLVVGCLFFAISLASSPVDLIQVWRNEKLRRSVQEIEEVLHKSSDILALQAALLKISDIPDDEAKNSLVNLALPIINAAIKNLVKNKEAVSDAADFYRILSLFLESNKRWLTQQNIYKLSTELDKLVRAYPLVSKFPVTAQRNPERVGDLISIFDVSVIDDQVLDNPVDALPKKPQDLTNLTQTEAYLSIPQLREKVIKTYGEALVHYPKLIQRIIEQERKYKQYDVFYHGQKRNFILLYDVIKEIQNWFEKVKNTPEFEYIRFPEGQSKKLSEFIRLAEELGEDFTDTNTEINRYLLPVNLSLFGNTYSEADSTFFYFLTSSNVAPPRHLLESIFTKLDLDTSYIPKILSLLAYLQSPTGSLLQIFIPRDKINEYVYPSLAFGQLLSTPAARYQTKLKPVTITKLDGQTVTHNLVTLDMANYLELYRNHPEALDPRDMDAIQGRINITHDFMLNPKSGAKIFRYTTMHPDRLLEYQQRLRELIAEVMRDWQRRSKTNL